MRFVSVFLLLAISVSALAQNLSYEKALPGALHIIIPVSADALTSGPQVALYDEAGKTQVADAIDLTSTSQRVDFDGLPLTAANYTVRITVDKGERIINEGRMPTRDALDLIDNIRQIAPDAKKYSALLQALGMDPEEERERNFKIYNAAQEVLAKLYEAQAQAARAAIVPTKTKVDAGVGAEAVIP